MHNHAQSVMAIIILMVLSLMPGSTRAQTVTPPVDCGVVDGLQYPVDDMTERGDDFGIYRGKFGGLHAGVDVAFYTYGSPVYAIARGRVTYSNPIGWDTEKGVVIIEHIFPDGSIYYSLYGHMEPIGGMYFPGIGQCVEQGAIVGAVGDPSLSAPHMHFEIRDFLPNDGGPGYWDTNPAEVGWEHPIDFIRRWQIALQGDDDSQLLVSSVTALNPPAVPPILTAQDTMLTASANLLEGVSADGDLLWRMEMSDMVQGMVLLSDGRVAVRLANDQILLLRNGRYDAMWSPPVVLQGAPILMQHPPYGDMLVFFTESNALAAFTPEGVPLWYTPILGVRIGAVTYTDDMLAINMWPTTDETYPALHLINSEGQIVYQVAPSTSSLAALNTAGEAVLLDGDTIYAIGADYAPAAIVRMPYVAGRSTALSVDESGNSYVFLALDEGYFLSYAPDGTLRWEGSLPGTHRQPPLLAAGEDCLLYALAADGMLYGLGAATGDILGETGLYAGGFGGNPNARLLEVLPGEQVRFGAGYLSVVTIDGFALAGLPDGVCPDASLD